MQVYFALLPGGLSDTFSGREDIGCSPFSSPRLAHCLGRFRAKARDQSKGKAAQLADLKVKLLPFQQESLLWMRKQEKYSEWKGGILADEMGGFSLFTPYLVLTTYQIWGRRSKRSHCS